VTTPRKKSDLVVPCEMYSRIVGYLRPVQNWSQHKKNEFQDRQTYVPPSRAALDAMEPAQEVASVPAD